MTPPADAREWLETDGLGGFAMGRVVGPRTRRYHGLLVTATTPPTGRLMLVSGFDATVETPAGRWSLTAQRYAGLPASEAAHVETFTHDPWPTWIFQLPDGTRLVHELFMRAGAPRVLLSWRLLTEPASVRLTVRPFLAGRDFHALMHENAAFSFEATREDNDVRFRPYESSPSITVASNGAYVHEPYWYRRFFYEEEQRRGLDCEEDLASPGAWRFHLSTGEATMILSSDGSSGGSSDVGEARGAERARRAALGGALDRAADQYVVARGAGRTIIAGYPWFGDWGRDTFIAMRGLLLARGRGAEALDVLRAWCGLVSEGMLPNCFPDGAGPPAYNTVDAPLWFIVAAAETIRGAPMADDDRRRLVAAVEAILVGYADGTRYGIRATDDGLLAAGEPGQQLTWMDARVDGREVTPRIGKPVEVQALWLNALSLAADLGAPSSVRWAALFARGRPSFEARFWNQARGCLYDVVDCDHVAGAVDARLRPNQIFAVGGLPLQLLTPPRAARVVAAVEGQLLTPIGLRTLAPDEPGYQPRYAGGVAARDGAYHEGTVWPWLMGPFVEAQLRVGVVDAQTARTRFIAPLLRSLDVAGLGHLPEVADGDAPHAPGGCPFQAWSLGELLRLDRELGAMVQSPTTSVMLPEESGRGERT